MLHSKDTAIHVSPESIITVLGVTYVHAKTSDDGDIYFTRFGLPFADILQIENWFEKTWFEAHRQRLCGTSAVYRIQTKKVNGKRLDLVVKNCRVGEDVPLETHTLEEFISAQFNSPWEEFALVMEMREGVHGPKHIKIATQEPLAIYVPPARMQIWQSGRSAEKIKQIQARHPAIELDILRQYKLVYQWIEGKDAVEMLCNIGIDAKDVKRMCAPITKRAIRHLDAKGYAVADMKPEHIIINERNVAETHELGKRSVSHSQRDQVSYVQKLVKRGEYSVIDYELLLRTPRHEDEVRELRRHTYLDDQRDRFVPTPLPEHLTADDIFCVPYVCGHAESTGGYLWVIGKNGRLFDYFLPERWRGNHGLRLSPNSEIFYAHTKDNVHLVWKTSRVGETPDRIADAELARYARRWGYNSPFEEAAIAQDLGAHGVPCVYMRAIYRTGSVKIERSIDERRYETHAALQTPDGQPVLQERYNYITVRGYFNGPDSWVAKRKGRLMRPIDARKACEQGLIDNREFQNILDSVRGRIKNAGYNGSLLGENDILLALDQSSDLVREKSGLPEARVCNFELIGKF